MKSASVRRNRVRIIGGEWRSRWLNFPDGQDLRPTPDRVRETLFNWLGQDLTGKTCLDLYAGSGALGFEAASRGARKVVLVERERVTVAALIESRAALKANQTEVVRADALEFLRTQGTDSGVYDVVFLDPPFADDHWPVLFERLSARLAPAAYVYRESGTVLPAPPGFEILREGCTGQVSHQLLKRNHHDH